MPIISPSAQFPRDGSDKNMARQVRGLAIVSIGSSIRRINKLQYRVKSQSSEETWYEVVKQYGHNIGGRQEGQWTCSCPDFQYRKIVCKHVYAVGFSKELRRRIVQQDVVQSLQPPIASQSVECPKCRLSSSIVRDGRRLNKGSI
ncbi:MAG: SWIM zinc finger family protein [Nitrososphaerales archaeon]